MDDGNIVTMGEASWDCFKESDDGSATRGSIDKEETNRRVACREASEERGSSVLPVWQWSLKIAKAYQIAKAEASGGCCQRIEFSTSSSTMFWSLQRVLWMLPAAMKSAISPWMKAYKSYWAAQKGNTAALFTSSNVAQTRTTAAKIAVR